MQNKSRNCPQFWGTVYSFMRDIYQIGDILSHLSCPSTEQEWKVNDHHAGDEPLENVVSCKYLGVIINKNLTSQDHIEYMWELK